MKISQRENYSANFGEVLRSSAIFWVKQDEGVSTVISFGNYWKFKNNTDVTLVLNARGHGGQLIERRRISFDDGEVMNLRPADGVASIEIEVFSLRNMRIPYSAIMAVYECKDSISMVHSYSRVYSQ
ncbi:MAG: hypothetical protein JWP52_3938, partial [Rhizobacter sp.]|nr:hypothetical protein [Rhizobacter sp.]